MSAQSESKKAKLERPADYYKSPEDITQDTELSPNEKREALNTWEQDARQMMTASNEGMKGDEEGLDQRDTHRLGEVVRAKECYRRTEPPELGVESMSHRAPP